MEKRKFDVAVIGAGTAGLAAFHEAEKNGARPVLIESGPYGTTCARVGCMPSKLLIAAADVAHAVKGAYRFGIELPAPPRIAGRAVLKRVRRERDRFVDFVLESTEEIPAGQRLRGRARFVAPTTLRVGEDIEVEARAFVVATGSAPKIPPGLEGIRGDVLTTDNLFELEQLPPSLAIVGTGAIGLELGQAFHRLGVRTVMFDVIEKLAPVSDPEVNGEVATVLGAELEMRMQAEVRGCRSVDGRIVLRWGDGDGAMREETFDRILAAIGRHPNFEGLDLPRAGVEIEPGRGPCFDPRTMQIEDLPIFLAGDASSYRPVLHEAADEGHIAGGNAARFPDVRAAVRRTPLSIVFTDPQIAVVGTTFRDLDRDAIEIGAASYDDQGRARVIGKNRGLVRIYAERQHGTIVGAEMFGPRVENTAHLLAWAVQRGMTVEEALHMPFYHPVLEEGIRTALRNLGAALKVRGRLRPEDLECGPGV